MDEFQNFAVESFATIFAEAAKYRLNLCVAHQTRDQLTPEIRAALGNASTYIVFRISADDAGVLARELRSTRWRTWDGASFDYAGFVARQHAQIVKDHATWGRPPPPSDAARAAVLAAQRARHEPPKRPPTSPASSQGEERPHRKPQDPRNATDAGVTPHQEPTKSPKPPSDDFDEFLT